VGGLTSVRLPPIGPIWSLQTALAADVHGQKLLAIFARKIIE
jgi:hypothetical protein